MEFLLELIIEIIAGGLVEGAVDGLDSKKVPMPLRILLAVFLFALLIGLGFIFVIAILASKSVALGILLGAAFVGLFGGLTWKVCKVFKKRKNAD
ncbi:MAG: hypothetical protein IJZ55_12785 [Lachnospiraceae bacterium]|nr:hypothetical protein [Lachnospiraceae bacterium]